MCTDFFSRIDAFGDKISRIFLQKKFYWNIPEQFGKELE